MRSSKDCTPTDTRFAPASRSASMRSTSSVPGLASTVNSVQRERSARSRRISPRRRISPGERTVGVPPPTNTVSGANPAGARRASSRSSAARYASGSLPFRPPGREKKSQ